MSNGVHYQIAEDNPVRDVFTTEKAAIELARNFIRCQIARSETPLQMFVERPDSELIYKIGVLDVSGNPVRVYNVIKMVIRS